VASLEDCIPDILGAFESGFSRVTQGSAISLWQFRGIAAANG